MGQGWPVLGIVQCSAPTVSADLLSMLARQPPRLEIRSVCFSRARGGMVVTRWLPFRLLCGWATGTAYRAASRVVVTLNMAARWENWWHHAFLTQILCGADQVRSIPAWVTQARAHPRCISVCRKGKEEPYRMWKHRPFVAG